MNSFKAWVRRHLPTWAQLQLLSRTVWGYQLMALGYLADHSLQVQDLLGQVGAPSWTPTVAGLILGLYARYSDASRGVNPA